jgi:hypothetical protein
MSDTSTSVEVVLFQGRRSVEIKLWKTDADGFERHEPGACVRAAVGAQGERYAFLEAAVIFSRLHGVTPQTPAWAEPS